MQSLEVNDSLKSGRFTFRTVEGRLFGKINNDAVVLIIYGQVNSANDGY